MCKSVTRQYNKIGLVKIMKFELLFLFLFCVLIIGCAPVQPEAGMDIEAEIPATEKAPEFIGPCDNLEFIHKKINSLAEEISIAEAELEGLKVDLEFAQEDQTNVAEIKELIQSQEEYINDLNNQISELQESIKEC